MVTDSISGWRPDWTVAPGEILLEALEERAMSQSELARRTGRPIKTINEIIHGKAAITSETALQFERVLGISARFWTGAQTAYRDQLARSRERQALEQSKDWLDGFPILDMVKCNLLPRHKEKSETVDSLLRYFRVSSAEAWNRYWLSAAASYRRSETFMSSPKAVSAWLRWGEIEASKCSVPSYSEVGFREALQAIPPLTRRAPFSRVFEQVQEACSEAGVIVLLTPELGETRVSGAARWIRGCPVIQLSARHRSDDQFWFTFFHESAHILHPSRKRDFIDDIEVSTGVDLAADEETANSFARELLIPSEAYEEFVMQRVFTRQSICRFADTLSVAPGIVVGRLQFDGQIEHSRMNHLKKRIRLLS